MRASDMLSDDKSFRAFEGVEVRKGTVAAFLANAEVLTDPDSGSEARTHAQAHIVESVAALRALGLFRILEIRDPALRAYVDSLP